VIGQLPRYSLEEPVFPFPALAAAAGRATLGGPREVTLVCLMAARLAAALVDTFEIAPEQHRERAERARQWSATLVVPGDVRAMLMRVIELAGRSDRAAAAAALDDLSAAASAQLDESSRAELRSVATKLLSAPRAEQTLDNNELQVS
jgi:hypothetical protein